MGDIEWVSCRGRGSEERRMTFVQQLSSRESIQSQNTPYNKSGDWLCDIKNGHRRSRCITFIDMLFRVFYVEKMVDLATLFSAIPFHRHISTAQYLPSTTQSNHPKLSTHLNASQLCHSKGCRLRNIRWQCVRFLGLGGRALLGVLSCWCCTSRTAGTLCKYQSTNT